MSILLIFFITLLIIQNVYVARDDIAKHCTYSELSFLVSINSDTYDAEVNIEVESFCVGSLIAPKWVLTAATCVKPLDDINDNKSFVTYGTPYPFYQNALYKKLVIKGFTHHYYDPDSVQKSSHNIGLLELESPIDTYQTSVQLVGVQPGFHFLQRCLFGLIPMLTNQTVQMVFTGADDVDPDIENHLQCVLVSIDLSCLGHSPIHVDLPNAICGDRSVAFDRFNDIGTPLLGATQTGVTIVGILSEANQNITPIFTRIDRYFTFIQNTTGIIMPFLSEPVLEGAFSIQFNVFLISVGIVLTVAL